MQIIGQLVPRTYVYRADEFPHLGLPEDGLHIGFVAQELEQVLPDQVEQYTVPLVLDSLGNISVPPTNLKGVNYVELIALLVGGMQEQQMMIDSQLVHHQLLNDRIDQLEQMILDCCQNFDGSDQRSLMDNGTGSFDQGTGDRNLRIQPSPFTEQTTVFYNLERSGRMQLMANSSDGKQLRVLHEAQMEQGGYQYEWQTADIAPGIYYVTLLLDGEPIVKKAVKVR